MRRSISRRTTIAESSKSAPTVATRAEVLPLTEDQGAFDRLLVAYDTIPKAFAELRGKRDTARADRVGAFAKAVAPPAAGTAPAANAIADLAKTASRDLSALDEKFEENREALTQMTDRLCELIEAFETDHRADALAVYRNRLSAIELEEAQKVRLEAKIDSLGGTSTE